MERKNGNWTIGETKQIFSNDFFEVFEDQVVQPDGQEAKFATIKFKEGVAVLPYDDEGNVYLTKQFRYAIGREDLEVAAGVVEDEDYLKTAKREAVEELGIKAENWIEFGVIEENTSVTKSTIRLFLARKLTFTEPKPEATEDIKIFKLPLKDGLQKVMKGEITHDLTCVLLMKTNLYLAEDY